MFTNFEIKYIPMYKEFVYKHRNYNDLIPSDFINKAGILNAS